MHNLLVHFEQNAKGGRASGALKERLRNLNTVWALICGLGLVAALFWSEYERAGAGKFIHTEWLLYLLWLVPSLMLARKATCLQSPDKVSPGASRIAPALILFGCMILFLVSGAVKHPWFFLLTGIPRAGRASTAWRPGWCGSFSSPVF